MLSRKALSTARRLAIALCCATAASGISNRADADAVSDAQMAQVYSRAARDNDEIAQFYLGALYSAGAGVQQSDTEAFQWFSRAANQGHAHAMLILGGLLAIGRGAPKDYVGSYKWAYIVAMGSQIEEFRKDAQQLIGLLEPKMTPTQIAQAKADALGFHATTPTAKLPDPPAPTPSTPSGSSSAARPDAASGSPRPGNQSRGHDLVKGVTPDLLRQYGIR